LHYTPVMGKRSVHLWLIRVYAIVILLAVLTGALEGPGFTLVLSIAAAGVLVQSFLLSKTETGEHHEVNHPG
jgi:hypothetical protein